MENTMRGAILIGSVVVFALGGLSACNQNVSSSSRPTAQNPQIASADTQPASKNEIVTTSQEATPTSASAKPTDVTATTKRYAEGAAMGDMFEIESSRVALDRSKSDDVKKFAQEMIYAHTKTSDEPKSALIRVGLIIELPTILDTLHQGLLDELKSANAQDFDKRYIAQQKSAHNEALMLHRSYASSGDMADVKALASDTVPKIDKHIEMITDIDRTYRARNARAENR
jgi:putative membrane protein